MPEGLSRDESVSIDVQLLHPPNPAGTEDDIVGILATRCRSYKIWLTHMIRRTRLGVVVALLPSHTPNEAMLLYSFNFNLKKIVINSVLVHEDIACCDKHI